MNSPSDKLRADLPPNHLDFSLVLGGPLFQMLRKARLSDDALQLVRRRIIFISLFCWLPLLILSAFDGLLLGGTAVPFLKDFEAHVRFLVVLPLLIAAELIVHQRMRFVVRQFLDRKLIPDDAMARFDAAISSAFRLRNSVVAEVLIIAFVYVIGINILWRQYLAIDTATWFATPIAGGGTSLTMTGTWLACVSLPIFQFLVFRWYFRLFIWVRFLWQVSRIPLSLVPTHPDRVGGLGFLSATARAFLPLAMAHGAMLAGGLANRIFYLDAGLLQFKVEIVALVVLLVCIVFGPLMVFAPQLAGAKRTGIREYDTLAQRYVREFDTKWLRGGAPPDEPFVGSGDIQSLADLGNSLEVMRGMRIAPISKDALIQLAVATLLPMLPLLLTMMSLEDLLKKLLGILF